MTDKSRARLGIVNGICVFLVVLGILAGISIFKIYTTKSASYGTPIIHELPGDKKDFYLNEDESVFFSYSTKSLIFEKTEDGKYEQRVLCQPLIVSPDKGYALYINGEYVATTIDVGKIYAEPILVFNKVGGGNYTEDIYISMDLYNDRSELIIRLKSLDMVGYFNQMTKSGFNIRIIEGSKPVTDNKPTILEDIVLPDNPEPLLYDSTTYPELNWSSAYASFAEASHTIATNSNMLAPYAEGYYTLTYIFNGEERTDRFYSIDRGTNYISRTIVLNSAPGEGRYEQSLEFRLEWDADSGNTRLVYTAYSTLAKVRVFTFQIVSIVPEV